MEKMNIWRYEVSDERWLLTGEKEDYFCRIGKEEIVRRFYQLVRFR